MFDTIQRRPRLAGVKPTLLAMRIHDLGLPVFDRRRQHCCAHGVSPRSWGYRRPAEMAGDWISRIWTRQVMSPGGTSCRSSGVSVIERPALARTQPAPAVVVPYCCNAAGSSEMA